MRLILQSTRDDHGSGSEGSRLFAAILTKPLRRSQLLGCVSRVMTLQQAAAGDPQHAGLPGAAPDACVTGPKILLVEDNPVNREVAAGMLESLGCVVETAENGWLAIESMNTTAYDAVFMDCQMPIMDGMTATGEIRRREQSSGSGRMHSSSTSDRMTARSSAIFLRRDTECLA